MLRIGQIGPPKLNNTRWDQFALLKNLSQPIVNQIKDKMKTQTFQAGELIITKGTIGTSMYMIDIGEARAMVCGEVAQTLHSGDCFGELAFMATCRKIMKQEHGTRENTLRACDVEAAVDCVVVTISVQDFLAVFYNNLEGSQAAIRAILQLESLAHKNRENIRRIEEGVLKRRESAGFTAAQACRLDSHRPGDGWRAVPVGESAKESWERVRELRVALEEQRRLSKKDRVLREISVLAGIYCHFRVFGAGGAPPRKEAKEPSTYSDIGERGAGMGGGGCRDARTGLGSEPSVWQAT